LLRCGQNIDHVGSEPRCLRPGKGDGENRGQSLFVHECRRIAAPAEGGDAPIAPLDSEDKGGRAWQ